MGTMRMNTAKTLTSLILLAALISGLIALLQGNNKQAVNDCKVLNLVQQQTLFGNTQDGLKTSIRYLVVTDKETFVCESSWINLKFNNSDIFYRLKRGNTYNFNVCGYGKSMFTDYRNILTVDSIR